MKTTLDISLVSIAVATYNGEKFLIEQLDTLVNQTYPNIEIIISDDGSTDGTLEILKEYEKKYPFISIIQNENPDGIKRNFENALKYCKGEYIAFSDQDDIWMLDKIEKLVNVIGENSLAYHDSLFVDQQGKSLNKSLATIYNCYSGNDSRVLFFSNTVSGHALLFHRKMLNIVLPFPKAMHHDWWLAFRAADNGGIKYLNEKLVHYRQHEKSVTDFLMIKKDKLKQEESERMVLEWYETCAAAPGAHHKFLTEWLRLFKDKGNHFWNGKFFFMNLFAMKKLYFMRRKSTMSTFFLILRSSWGDKIKSQIRNKKN